MHKILAIVGMFFSFGVCTNTTGTEFYCDLETGQPGDLIRQYLTIANIEPQQVLSDYPSDHVLNLDRLLQTNGCFQRDYEFYKNGGRSPFNLIIDQAKKFLDLNYSVRQDIIPRYSPDQIEGDIDVVFEGGVRYTVTTGLRSLKTMMEQGYSFRKIHFSFINPMQENIDKLKVDTNYDIIFKNLQYEPYVCEPNQNTLEVNLRSMKDHLAKRYVIVSDPIRCRKSEQTAKGILGDDYSCLGIISIPSKDWTLDMKEYGYLDDDEATIAFAKSAWNFIARQIHTEADQFKKAHGLVG